MYESLIKSNKKNFKIGFIPWNKSFLRAKTYVYYIIWLFTDFKISEGYFGVNLELTVLKLLGHYLTRFWYIGDFI